MKIYKDIDDADEALINIGSCKICSVNFLLFVCVPRFRNKKPALRRAFLVLMSEQVLKIYIWSVLLTNTSRFYFQLNLDDLAATYSPGP